MKNLVRIPAFGVCLGIAALLFIRAALAADITPPVVVITSPAATVTRVFSNSVNVVGRASDAGGVASVLVQIGDSDYMPATGSSNWSATVALSPGTNRVRVKAVDLADNTSRTNSRVIIQVPNAPLELITNGSGRVTPLTNGQRLEIGRPYTIRASPRPGNLFSNWTGTITSTNPVLSFRGASNFTATANFVTNPFIALKGVYTGLVYDTNHPTHGNSAFFTFTLTSNGRFSGRLTLAGTVLVGGGVFGLDLHSHTPIFAGTEGALELQLTAGSDRIEGFITNGVTTRTANGYRATFSAANPATPFAGRYAMLLSGGTNVATSPIGWGVATVSITTNGAVILKGTLADNTPFMQSLPLSSDGRFPIYVPLYAGRGSLFGWVRVSDGAYDLSGSLLWTKTSPGKGPFYPSGFANDVQIRANPFFPQNFPSTLSNVFARFEGGNLPIPVTNAASFIPPARLTSPARVTFPPLNPDRIVLTYNPASGLFTGSFKNYATGRTSPIKAVMLLWEGFAAGFFVGTNQSGAFYLGQENNFPPFPPAP